MKIQPAWLRQGFNKLWPIPQGEVKVAGIILTFEFLHVGIVANPNQIQAHVRILISKCDWYWNVIVIRIPYKFMYVIYT